MNEAARAALDPTIITLIGGQILTVIAAIAAAIVAVINALRTSDLKRQQETNTSQIVAVAKDTEAIKGHVNSEKTASEGREHTLRQENVLLREMVAEKRTTAGLLAQAAALRGRPRQTDAPGGGDVAATAAAAATVASAAAIAPATELLQSIDQHTADTAANTSRTEDSTRRTEAKVDRLDKPDAALAASLLDSLVAEGRLTQAEADAIAAAHR